VHALIAAIQLPSRSPPKNAVATSTLMHLLKEKVKKADQKKHIVFGLQFNSKSGMSLLNASQHCHRH
jgi:hypothetical protein